MASRYNPIVRISFIYTALVVVQLICSSCVSITFSDLAHSPSVVHPTEPTTNQPTTPPRSESRETTSPGTRSSTQPPSSRLPLTISRRIQVPQGEFGPILPDGQVVAGSQSIANPGIRLRISQDDLVVGVSLLPEPRVGTKVRIIEPGLLSQTRWDTITDRAQRGTIERQINSLLQVDLIPGRPLVIELEDSRIIEVIPSTLEVPSFFRSILVLIADGIQPRIAVLPSEFTLVSSSTARSTSNQPLLSAQEQEAFLNRTTGLLEDLVLLAGGTLADRREVHRVLLETDLSVSELFSTEGILPFGARIPADYGLVFAVQVFQDSSNSESNLLQRLDMIVRLVKIPEGTIEAVYRERVVNF
jgi:hypothetical protein